MVVEGISVFTGRPVKIQTEGDTIVDIREIDTSSKKLPYVGPAFLDMQVNGYRGRDYSSPTFDPSQVRPIIEDLARAGTAIHLPTIVTGPQEMIVRNLSLLVSAMKSDPLVHDGIAGFHIEGPYISAEDGPRGAHDRSWVRDPSKLEFEEWQDAAEGLVKIVTVAPERKGAIDFIRYISERGVIAAIGHTAAGCDMIAEAVRAGARLSTHLGNGSHAELPRLSNYIWEQLGCDCLQAGIIADGFHLPPPVIKVFASAKGFERLIIVSDVAPPAGNPPGVYKWNAIDAEVFPDGHIGLAGTPFLAGAGHLLDWDVPHFMRFTASGLSDTLRLCTVNPGRLLGFSSLFGNLQPGSPANLILFEYEDGMERLGIKRTLCSGRVVFSVDA